MRKEFWISIVISFTFLSLGFVLLHYELIGYGLSFFVFLPFALGYILGKSTIKAISLWGLIISLTAFFILLLAGGLEGMVCILMAMPLVIGAVAFGVLVKYLIKKYNSSDRENLIKSSVLPLFFFIGFGFIEAKLTGDDNVVVEVKSEITLPYSSIEVYETIKSVDTLNAERPFLMKLDLPVPRKCILEDEEVGGIRTCYFDGGRIVEKITELERGKIMRMDVIDYELTGRRWLGFKEAIYVFDELQNGQTRLTRITTYTSELHPAFYWRPLEKIGIEQEHEYVFRNLKKDLKNRYPR